MPKIKRSERWEWQYRLAKDYFLEHGNLLVPGDYVTDGEPLGAWIRTQRWDYKHGGNVKFTAERIRLLEAIGMVWDVREAAWDSMIACCKAYLRQHGDIRIPQTFIAADGHAVGIWLNKQRMDYRAGNLSRERVKHLENLGIHWNPETLRRSQWDINFELLKAYKNIHGNVLVPADFIDPTGMNLGTWITNQRKNFADGKLSSARRKKLESVGMVWDVIDRLWDDMHQKAKDYYEKHGHLNPYANRSDKMEASLRNWLIRQRQIYRKGTLSESRVRALEAIGMLWQIVDARWDAMYQKAKKYYKEHGHLLVSKDSGSKEERELGRWIYTQRKVYRETDRQLKQGRIEKLEAIGMVWDACIDVDALWETWFKKAKTFYQKNGHLNPPLGRLQTWVMAQKYKKKGNRGGISEDKARRLSSIGIVWDVLESQWIHMYRLAKKFYRIHEKLNIPVSYLSENGEHLGIWIARQRTVYKNLKMGLCGGGRGKITQKQVDLLNEIEMIWDASVLSTRTSFEERAIHFYLRRQCPDVCKLSYHDEFGFELDVFLPKFKTGIEYDGYLHADKTESDTKKNFACLKNGIRLIRIREAGLPEILGCNEVIVREELTDKSFELTIRTLLQALSLKDPLPDLVRDRAAIYAEYKDYVSYRWDSLYEQIYHYVKSHGIFPKDETMKSREGTGFISWLRVQRRHYFLNELTKSQIRKLEKLGMVWEPLKSSWNSMYALAKDYHKDHGNLMISAGYVTPSGQKLGKWLSIQRSEKLHGSLSAKHVQLLESLGIDWAPLKTKQQAARAAAADYYKRNGHIDIPCTYVDEGGIRLGAWLSDQRSRYRNGTLSEDLCHFLEKRNVKWSPDKDRWDAMYQAAVHYYNQHENIWTAHDFVTEKGEKLGLWISSQRAKYYQKGKGRRLSEEQIAKLEAIGMVWDPYTEKWMRKYLEAKHFFETHGHLNVPADYVTQNGIKLGMWICSQRQANRGNPNFVMTQERRRLLSEIGMNWTLKRANPNARRRSNQT